MINNAVSAVFVPLCALPSFLHAATRQKLESGEMGSLADEEDRTTPAKVYPASQDGQVWIVEAPASDEPKCGERKTFTGSVSQLRALEYAHSAYGSAILLTR